jgi:hypothetical protein
MEAEKWPEQSAREKYLSDRHLKFKYSNLKSEQLVDGKYIYKQRSHCGKVDHDQKATVCLDPGVEVIGVFKYPKYKTERTKRGPKK